MHYWLIKSEPITYGIQNLAQKPHKADCWEGVRNFQARNFIRSMQKNDQAFFYHSNCKEPGIVGIVTIIREAYPDPKAWDPKSPYYDKRASQDNPLWSMMDVKLKETFHHIISLKELRHHEKQLNPFPLLTKGNRLSIIPVTAEQWNFILTLKK